MKKLLLISLVLSGILLKGCSQQKWLSQDELFEKKQECISYKDKMNIQVIQLIDSDFEVNEIFYSPIKNSCLYTAKVKYWIKINDFTDNSLYTAVIDYFNNTIIENTFWEIWEFIDWKPFSSTKSTCFNKYIGDDFSISEDNIHSVFPKYLECKKKDFDIKVKEFKWE